MSSTSESSRVSSISTCVCAGQGTGSVGCECSTYHSGTSNSGRVWWCSGIGEREARSLAQAT